MADEALSRRVRDAWRAPDSRPSRPAGGLSTSVVVEAAVALADTGGLDAVTIRALSQSLGFTTMAVYRHIESREELITLMVDLALDAPEPEPTTDWREGMRAWAAGLVERYRRHPWLIDGPPPGLPRTPRHALWIERALAVLAALPLTLQQKLDLALLVDAYARTVARLAHAMEGSGDAAARTAAEVRALLDPERFPHFSDALAAGALEDTEPPDPGFGLDCILAGVETLIRTH